MMNPYEYRRRFSLDLPFKCEGFTIDDYVEYVNDNGENCKGYIYCFREDGYNWFAYIYTDRDTLKTVDNVHISKLKKLCAPFVGN